MKKTRQPLVARSRLTNNHGSILFNLVSPSSNKNVNRIVMKTVPSTDAAAAAAAAAAADAAKKGLPEGAESAEANKLFAFLSISPEQQQQKPGTIECGAHHEYAVPRETGACSCLSRE